MTAHQPHFSIITPTFNRADLIERVIDSVQRQTFTDWELIIVDDGSTDSTREVVRSRADLDARIRLETLGRNSGLPAVARNCGLAEARGELIAFLDSDDYWWPNHLEYHAQSHASTVTQGLTYSHLWTRRPGWPLFGLLLLPSPRQQARTRPELLQRNSLQCSATSAPRSLLVAVGGFNESPSLAAVEDYELWLRCADAGPVTFIPRVTGVYTMAQGISAERNMETQLANLSGVIQEPIGRRSRPAIAIERLWGVPAALASLGAGSLPRGRQRH